MASLGRMVNFVLFLAFYFTVHLQGFSLNRVKRDGDQNILSNINSIGSLQFNYTLVPQATRRRTIKCLVFFDAAASADLNYNYTLATAYVNQLVSLTSMYTAHANIQVVWALMGLSVPALGDIVVFPVGVDSATAMASIASQFQAYLAQPSIAADFGKVVTVGVFISKNPLVQGGYSQAPECTTSGVSVISYNQYPWSIAGLLAHELGHTLSLVHTWDLPSLCQNYPALTFCQPPNSIPDSCACNSLSFPPSQCIMTYSFGAATINAPQYTACDIEVMNYFSSNTPCLFT